MGIKFTNFAASTIADAGGLSAIGTEFSVAAGDGALFPALGAGDYFYIVVVKATGDREVMKVTARTLDAFTVVREQDSTTALVFARGDKVELRVTAGVLNEVMDEYDTAMASFSIHEAAVNNPHAVTVDQLGVTATAEEINAAADGAGVSFPRRKIIEIGPANLQSSTGFTVAHGLTANKIVGVRGTIRQDGNIGYHYPHDYWTLGEVGGAMRLQGASIIFSRNASGKFNSSDFSVTAGSYNRGWVIVDYIN